MKNTDDGFKAFKTYYQNADFDNAANILYQAIAKIVKNALVLNPLVKPDFSNILKTLAGSKMPVPTKASYRDTIAKAVRFLLNNYDANIQQTLN